MFLKGAANGESEHSPKDAEAFEAHLFKTMKDMAENAKEMTVSLFCLHILVNIRIVYQWFMLC